MIYSLPPLGVAPRYTIATAPADDAPFKPTTPSTNEILTPPGLQRELVRTLATIEGIKGRQAFRKPQNISLRSPPVSQPTMDRFYDIARAGEKLADLAAQRILEDPDNSYAYLAKIQPTAYYVDHFTHPTAWRICSSGNSSGEVEEGSFRIQGVLVAKDLPPIAVAGNRVSKTKALNYSRQHIKITAFGSEFMNDAILKVEEMYVKMSRFFPDGVLEPWTPPLHEDFIAIEANTRYLTQTKHSNSANIVDFAPYVDINGNLQALMGTEWVHTTDNRVDYFKAIRDSSGAISYEVVDPVSIKIGDIVEATVALVALPTKSKTVKLQVLLRTLVLFDQTERDRAAILRMRDRYKAGNRIWGPSPDITKQPILKRKCPYVKTGVDNDAEERFQRMRLD